MKDYDIEISKMHLLELYCDIEMMKADNTEREQRGEALAYGEEQFAEVSLKISGLRKDLIKQIEKSDSVIKQQMKDTTQSNKVYLLEHKNKQLEQRWEKLKEEASNRAEYYESEKEKFLYFADAGPRNNLEGSMNLLQSASRYNSKARILKQLINRMEELENGQQDIEK